MTKPSLLLFVLSLFPSLTFNQTLARLYGTGQIGAIYDRWFGKLGKPSTLLSATFAYYSTLCPTDLPKSGDPIETKSVRKHRGPLLFLLSALTAALIS